MISVLNELTVEQFTELFSDGVIDRMSTVGRWYVENGAIRTEDDYNGK